MNTTILYEDNSILVIRKPAGIPTQTAKVGAVDVVSELKRYLKDSRDNGGRGEPYLGIVHRLDQPVGGLLVFAKTREAAAVLSEQLTNGELGKKYKARVSVEGESPAVGENRRLVDHLYKDEKGRAIVVDETDPRGKRAELEYTVISIDEDINVAELDIRLYTGRYHQIRAQLANAGLPILGDLKYGNAESRRKSGELGIKYVGLCADRLSFIHPESGKIMEFETKI